MNTQTQFHKLDKTTVLTAAASDPDKLHIFYVGQVGFIFAFRGTYIGIDLFLSQAEKEAGDPWIRSYAPPVDICELDFLDYVIVTHDHDDHTDPYTLRALVKRNDKAKFIVPAAFSDKVSEYGIPADRIIPAHAETVIEAGEISVRPVPAAHEVLHRNESGDYEEMGYVLDLAGIKLYHSGDCCIYDGQEASIGPVDITILPINGRSYYRLRENIIGNMTAEEAFILSERLRAKLFIPAHFDLFPNNGVPEEFIPVLHDLYAPSLPMRIPHPGEHFIYP